MISLSKPMRFEWHQLILAIVLVALMPGCHHSDKRVFLDDLEQIPVSDLSSNSDPDLYSSTLLDFEDYFRRSREVRLSDDILFGNRISLEVGPQGQFIVMDTEKAGLFDESGGLIAHVSPENCHPGFDWNPAVARFLPDGGFLVTGWRSEGFWFDEQGVCTSRFPHRYSWTHMDMTADSTVVFARFLGPEANLIRLGPRQAKVDTVFSGTSTLMQNNMPAGGLVAAKDDIHFLVVGHSPFVYRIDGSRVEKLGYLPEYFRPVERDITSEELANQQAFFARAQEILSTNSITGYLYELSDDYLLIRHSNVSHTNPDESRRPIGAIHVMDKRGNPVTSGQFFLMDLNPATFSRGSMFVFDYGLENEGDASINPKIVEYKFIKR